MLDVFCCCKRFLGRSRDTSRGEIAFEGVLKRFFTSFLESFLVVFSERLLEGLLKGFDALDALDALDARDALKGL